MRMRFDENVQKSGITRANWTVIAAVARIPGATQKSIADALQISEVSAGRLINRLCREGLLNRVASAADRRAYVITVTDKAQPLLHEMAVIAEAHEAQAFQGLGPAEMDMFERVLIAIEANLEAPTEKSPAPGG